MTSRHEDWCSRVWTLAGLLFVAGAIGLVGQSEAEEPAKLQVLVVAGGHGYPVEPFRAVFKPFDDMAVTFVDEKVGGEALEKIDDWPYQAMVLYNYEKKLSEAQQANFLALMDRGVGLVILHHAIYGYRSWPEWQKIVGVTRWLSGAKHGMHLKIHVEDSDHPITRGLEDFEIDDETYQGHDVLPGMRVLLSTDEPTNSRPICWVHEYRKSRVCYFQLGHDEMAYRAPQFGEVLGRAIRWSAPRPTAARQ